MLPLTEAGGLSRIRLLWLTTALLVSGLGFWQHNTPKRHLVGPSAAGALDRVVCRLVREPLSRQVIGDTLFAQLKSVTASKTARFDH